jgi:hypothetical protein
MSDHGYSISVMSRVMKRSAIGCVMACGALAIGPSLVGVGIARADLLGGVGPDINVLGIDVLGGDQKNSSKSAGAKPRANAVSTTPSARTVVIRAEEPAAQVEPEMLKVAPAVATADVYRVPAASPVPAAAPLSAEPLSVAPPPAVMPLPAAPAIRPPAPRAHPIPATAEPGPGPALAPVESFEPPTKIPDSFRVGYAEYLRSATTSDILIAAIPGMAGIAGFTLLGAYAGYRQARAVQAALLAPVPTRILM